MPPYAVPADITSRWIGPGAPDDDDQLAVLIGDAETVIRREFPDIADRIGQTGGPSADDVKLVVVSMVSRLYRNPEGIRSRNKATGPFQDGVTYAGDNPGALTLTDDERATLRGPGITSENRAYSIDTMPTASPKYLGGRSVASYVINEPEPA